MAAPPFEDGAVQLTVTVPSALAVAVPMVGAPGAVGVTAAAAMVVDAMVTGVAAGIVDELVRSLAGSAVVPVGQPWTVVEMAVPRREMVALESNSVICAFSTVPTAPDAVMTVLMVGKVMVAPAGISVVPVDTWMYGSVVVPAKAYGAEVALLLAVRFFGVAVHVVVLVAVQ